MPSAPTWTRHCAEEPDVTGRSSSPKRCAGAFRCRRRISSPNTYSSKVFSDYKGGRKLPYRMRNAGDSRSGTFDLRAGTHGSVNTFYVQLQERAGVEAPAALAESMGLRQFADGATSALLLRSGSFVLGANEVSPLALAGAYAAFASRGLYCPPRAVTSIQDAAGQAIVVPPPPCQQVLDAEFADTVNDILQGVIDGPYNGRTGRAAAIGRPAAGKTGTTNGSRAAWFAGYTPSLATTVWVGRVPSRSTRNASGSPAATTGRSTAEPSLRRSGRRRCVLLSPGLRRRTSRSPRGPGPPRHGHRRIRLDDQ